MELLKVIAGHPSASPALRAHLTDLTIHHPTRDHVHLGLALAINPATTLGELERLVACPRNGHLYATGALTRPHLSAADAAALACAQAQPGMMRDRIAAAVLATHPDATGQLLARVAEHFAITSDPMLAALANPTTPAAVLAPYVDQMLTAGTRTTATARALPEWLGRWGRTDPDAAAVWATARAGDPDTTPALAARLTDVLTPRRPGSPAWFACPATTTRDVLRWARTPRTHRDRRLGAWTTAIRNRPEPAVLEGAVGALETDDDLTRAGDDLGLLILGHPATPAPVRDRAAGALIQRRALPGLEHPSYAYFLRVAPWSWLTFLAATRSSLEECLAAAARPDATAENFARLADIAARCPLPHGATALMWGWRSLTHPHATETTRALAARTLDRGAALAGWDTPAAAQVAAVLAGRVAREPWAHVGADLPVAHADELLHHAGPGFTVVVDTALNDLLPAITTIEQARALTRPELRVGTLAAWFDIAATVGA